MTTRIAKIAVKLNGKVYTAPVGNTHQDVREEHNLAGQGRGRRGFVTSNGSFVGRETGADIAKAAGQLRRPVTEGKLHSTDLKGHKK